MTGLYLPVAPVVIERAQSVPDAIRNWTPKSRLGMSILKALPHLPKDLALELIDRIQSVMVFESELRVSVFRGRDGLSWAEVAARGGLPRVEDYGVVSRKVITTAGVGYIVDAFQNLVEPESMKYHGLGTGTGAEASSDSALGTELTTEYNPDNTRATGTNSESSSNVFTSVATNTIDSGTPAITEHGLFSAASGGVLFDRSKFAAINLASGDGIQSTYSGTFTAGG